MPDLVTKTVGEGEKELLFLMGFGCKLTQPGMIWTMERFAEVGFRSTFVEMPPKFEEFNQDVLDPCREIEKGMGDHVLIGFSMGGLTGSYLDDSLRRIFLSPFWGINENLHKAWTDFALRNLRVIRFRMLPRKFDPMDMGEFAVKEDLEDLPEFLDFHSISELRDGQLSMPPPRDDDVVYWSREDFLVGHGEIEEREVEQRFFKGGHMIYLVKDRQSIFREIIDLSLSAFDRDQDT